MKEFQFNENGVCENPNVIFRTTNKNVDGDYFWQTRQSFTINTAQSHAKNGKWCYGFHIFGRDFSYGYPCSFRDGSFDTERAAINAAIDGIKRQMEYADFCNHDATPPYNPSLKKMLAQVRLDNLQLSLF